MQTIALVGRPNVGKSTLFNILTRSQNALVMDQPGVTRDRLYGELHSPPYHALVIDTGGLEGEPDPLTGLMREQTLLAIEEADRVLFVVDAIQGLTPADRDIADLLRTHSKHILLVINKTDGLHSEVAAAEFYQLGFKEVVLISAAHRRGIQSLIEAAITPTPDFEDQPEDDRIKIALIGRPNVGKSTLTNRLLGEERTVVSDLPGTTRDSLYIPFEKNGELYTLIDTAGVRKKGRVSLALEKFSIVKTLQAIRRADVAILLIDATEGVTEQDLHVLGFALDAGKGLVIAVNKWDNTSKEQQAQVQREIERRLPFVLDYVDVHFISAKTGSFINRLYPSIRQAYTANHAELSTPALSRVLEQAILDHSPPLVKGRRIKLRYAHVGGTNPLVIVIHGNQTERLPESYRRYLTSTFRKAFNLRGIPIRLELKSSQNPFVQ